MLKVTQRYANKKPAVVADTLTLPYELRKKGRFKAATDSGLEVGLFIDRGKVLSEGELLQTDCGQVLQVRCQPEAVITARAEDWTRFARVCYHLGNRHVPLQVGDRWLRFQPDHVLEQLVRHFGLETRAEQAPFDPENGAYGDFGGHHHHH